MLHWMNMPRVLKMKNSRLAICIAAAAASLMLTGPAFSQQASPELVETEAQEGAAGPEENDVAPVVAAAAEDDADLAYGAFQRGYYLTAFELALPRAQLGDPKAQTLIAELYDRGLGIPRDAKEAAAWYKIAAGNGDREAQFGYAVKLLEGRHVDADKAEAKRLLKLAADEGHATAAFNYAQLILDEQPTVTGVRTALPYLEQAAAAHVSDSYYALSQIYQSGKLKGYPEEDKALDWMLKAAKAGIDTAQVELGIWLVNGYSGVKDDKAGFGWMQRAALGGNVIARNRLAKMYAQGVGTKADPVEAAKWHILAKRAGLADAWLDDFINTIDRKQLAKGLEAANRWPSG